MFTWDSSTSHAIIRVFLPESHVHMGNLGPV